MSVHSAAMFDSAAITDTGRTRDTNEDCLIALPEWGVFVVADGVGGLAAGDVASRQVCSSVGDRVADFNGVISDTYINNAIRGAVADANALIRGEALARGVRGMGSTVVLFVLSGEDRSKGVVLHAGDSRFYRLRDQQMEQLTEDHSIAGQLGVREDTLHPFMQGVITRAIGIQVEVDLEETPVDVCDGDVFLICSDGLTRMLKDEAIQAILLEEGLSLDAAARKLVDEANAAGGFDNISVILVRVGPPGPS